MSVQIVTAPRASSLIYGIAKAACQKIWILPANCCPAVPLALLEAGAQIEFVDININSLCLDTNLAKKKINRITPEKLAGIIYVRSYGYSPSAKEDLTKLRMLIGEEVVLIDDRCLSHPIIDFNGINSFGANVALFSTGYSKVIDLGMWGYGAFYTQVDFDLPLSSKESVSYDIVTQIYKEALKLDRPVFSQIDSSKIIPKWVPGGNGLNWKDLKEKIVEKKLHVIKHKQELNSLYKEGLANYQPLADKFQIWRFNIRVDNPVSVLSALYEAGLFASDHYYPTARLWGDKQASTSMIIYKSIINLFNDRNFSLEQAELAIDTIKRTANKCK